MRDRTKELFGIAEMAACAEILARTLNRQSAFALAGNPSLVRAEELLAKATFEDLAKRLGYEIKNKDGEA